MSGLFLTIQILLGFVHRGHAASQQLHVVGDTNQAASMAYPWAVPPSVDHYATWASTRAFTVGDVLGISYMAPSTY